MAIAWTILTKSDLAAFLAQGAIAAADVELDSGATVADLNLSRQTKRVREAIRNGGRTALSLTTGTSGDNATVVYAVPPSAETHVLALVCRDLVATLPNLAEFAATDTFKKQIRDAEDWIKEVWDGRPVEDPADPDPANTPTAVQWSDLYGDQTEYANGQTTAGVTLPIDDMTVN